MFENVFIVGHTVVHNLLGVLFYVDRCHLTIAKDNPFSVFHLLGFLESLESLVTGSCSDLDLLKDGREDEQGCHRSLTGPADFYFEDVISPIQT